MREDELYKLLSGTDHRDADWVRSAEQFMKLKIASGGVLKHEVDQLHKLASLKRRLRGMSKVAAGGLSDSEAPVGLGSVKVSPEEQEDATHKGMLSAIRSKVTGDASRAEQVNRKRGENISKLLGMLGGGAAGGLAGRALGGPGVAGPAVGMLAGALGGNALGKTVGSEIDRQRMLAAAPKMASPDIEKASDFEQSKAGCMASKVAAVRERLRAKLAQDDQGMSVQPEAKDTKPELGGGVGGEGHPMITALQDFFDEQQRQNEAEFFRQRAEEAQAQASQLQETAQDLQQQNEQLQTQVQQAQQSSQMQAEVTQQQTQQAQSEAQMAQQDAMAARDESLQAQQQNLEIRDAVTQYRQQLMNLLSQDPLSMMGAPAAPTGPAPMPPAGPEAGPGAEGMPPGAEGMPSEAQGGPQEAAGGPEGAGGPPPGAEGGGVPPEGGGEAPQQSQGGGGGGGSTGVTVNVKAPKAEKPKAPKPAENPAAAA